MARRTDNKGRSTVGARHVRLHHWLMKSWAWRALSPVERCTYLEIAKRYDGKNNGFIAMSCRDVAAELHVSKATAARALKQLERLGFVEVTTPGGFSRKVRHATEYRLTEHKCDRTGQMASKPFMSWKPDGEKIQNTVS